MAPLLALLAAVAWGSSDFAAGHASRRTSAVSVVVLTHLAAVGVLVWFTVDLAPLWSDGLRLAIPVWRGAPTLADAGWGLGAGLGGGFGSMLLFRGLGRGSMAVVAPITAAGAAVIPAAVGIATGDSLSRGGQLGVVLALVAIVLLSSEQQDDAAADDRSPGAATGGLLVAAAPAVAQRRRSARPGVVDALGSGVGFGLFFVCLSRASEAAEYWPLFTARSVSVVLFAVVAWRTSVPLIPTRGGRAPVVLAGVLDATAAVLFVLATRTGSLTVVAVLASLYPGATVFLAWAVARERVGRLRVVGLLIAGGAVALLAS